jgi:hypothetical protein
VNCVYKYKNARNRRSFGSFFPSNSQKAFHNIFSILQKNFRSRALAYIKSAEISVDGLFYAQGIRI